AIARSTGRTRPGSAQVGKCKWPDAHGLAARGMQWSTEMMSLVVFPAPSPSVGCGLQAKCGKNRSDENSRENGKRNSFGLHIRRGSSLSGTVRSSRRFAHAD